MRFMPLLCSTLVATVLSACAVPGLILSMGAADPAKLTALGKGAPVTDVDKALGMTKPLWSHAADVSGTPYQFRVYDAIQSAPVVAINKVCEGTKCWGYDERRITTGPYAIVYTGKEPRMHAWGALSQLRNHEDPAVVAMLPELSKQYDAYMAARK